MKGWEDRSDEQHLQDPRRIRQGHQEGREQGGGRDTGERYRQALRDRFLCRVFSDPENRFILKGGSGMLARVPNARATRDADFATRRNESPDEIVNALDELLAADMGDFCHFELTRREESKDDNGYSRLLKLRYATYIGEEEKTPYWSTCRLTAR